MKVASVNLLKANQGFKNTTVCRENKAGLNSVSESAQNVFVFPSSSLMRAHYAQAHPKKQLHFRGAPWDLNPPSGSVTAQQAIKLFDKLKLGNYLDLDGNPNSPSNRRWREYNLSFLDNIADAGEKRKFIEHYKSLTGFPDLQRVSSKVERAFVDAVDKAEEFLQDEYPQNADAYEVLWAGYDGVCSVAKGRAFPGSDLDKAFVVIKGSGSDYNDDKLLGKFKEHLWKKTDQRILSYNHDVSAFPQVYTLGQVEKLMGAINKKTAGSITPGDFRKYQGLMRKFDKDYVRANKFFVDLCRKFPRGYDWDLDASNPSREDIYSFGYFLEAFVRGKQLKGSSIPENIKNSDAAKLINVSQLEALKRSNESKSKYNARGDLKKKFDRWSVDEQLKFIKTAIKASCTDNEGYNEYFKSSEDARFKALMDAVGV